METIIVSSKLSWKCIFGTKTTEGAREWNHERSQCSYLTNISQELSHQLILSCHRWEKKSFMETKITAWPKYCCKTSPLKTYFIMFIDSVDWGFRQNLVRMAFVCYMISGANEEWNDGGRGYLDCWGLNSFADILTHPSVGSYWLLARVHKHGLSLGPSFTPRQAQGSQTSYLEAQISKGKYPKNTRKKLHGLYFISPPRSNGLSS